MTAAGVPSNTITYTCLIEAAVLSGDIDMAQRVFARAMGAGVTNSVQLYTAAINACMTDEHTNFDAAFEIYTTMQRHGVEPDDLLYGHLIAIAGRCRKLEVGTGLGFGSRLLCLYSSQPSLQGMQAAALSCGPAMAGLCV
jgi:pentatricopeptide repeat protein